MKNKKIIHRLTLKGLPFISLNKFYAGMHWSKRKNLANDYWAVIKSQTNQTFTNPCNVIYHFYFAEKIMDVSNCGAMVKLIEDVLFPDDSIKVVKSLKTITHKSDKNLVKIIINEL